MLPHPVCCFPLLLLFVSPPLLAAGTEYPVDCHGNALPAGALARLGSGELLHGSEIKCLAFSPDGKILASGGADKQITLWLAQSRRKIRTLEGHLGSVDSLVFSPDSKLLISASHESCSQGDLRLWEVATGRLVFHLLTEDEPTLAVAFSPDGKTIFSAHTTNRVRLWNARTGEMTREWNCNITSNEVSSVAFSPDGKRMAAAGDKVIRYLDLCTGKELPHQGKIPGYLHALAFSPDGTILAVANQRGLQLCRATDLKEIQELQTHQTVLAVVISPDGKSLVTANYAGPIRLRNLASGQELREFPRKHRYGKAIAISPDGKTVASADDDHVGSIDLWDVSTGVARNQRGVHLDAVHQVVFLRDRETILTRCGDSSITLWPPQTGKNPIPMQLPPETETCQVCSDRSTLAVTTDRHLLLLEIASGREIVRLPLAKNTSILAVHAFKKRAAVRLGGKAIEVLDLSTGKTLHRCDPATQVLGFSPDGQRVVLATGDDIAVWDLDNNKEHSHLVIANRGPNVFSFSPKGHVFATVGIHGKIQVHETATGGKRLQMANSEEVCCLAFSPDGQLLASGTSDGTVHLWDLRDGKEVKVFTGHQGPITAVDFSPDGCRLGSGSKDTTALIWEIPAAIRTRWNRKELTKEEQTRLWSKLAGEDAALAYDALQQLAAAPAQAVALCRSQFTKTPTPMVQVQRWIVDLDDEEFTVREQASRNLERIEGEAKQPLEKALKGNCSLEVRQRIKAVLEQLQGKDDRLCMVRAVELLELIGTTEAVDLLRQVEKKAGDDLIRAEIHAALGRITEERRVPR